MKKTLALFLKQNWKLLLFFSFWIAYFAAFWSRAIFFDSQGNFWAGHVNLWGDWPAHFTMANAMATRGLFIDSPFLIHANFSYPFVADYLSALLLNAGVPFIPAFTVPSFFFSLLIVAALYLFYKTLFVSKKVAVTATMIFLFNGGIGFYYFLQDIANSASPLATFLAPAHEYTRMDNLGIRWISVIDSMIIPQRSFAMGFSCALIALAMVYRIFFSRKNSDLILFGKKIAKKWQIFFVGLLLGFLPILHTHSFLATFIFLSWWAILDLGLLTKPKERMSHFLDWITIAGVTSLIALPLLKIYFLTNTGNNFFHIQLGWMANEFHLNWLDFTWRNWGITPIFAVLAWIFIYVKTKYKLVAALILPSFFIFMLSNIFLFQPWSWDNTKLLVWFLLGSSALISYFLVHFFQSKNKVLRLAMIILFLIVTGSGIIDAYRIQRVDLHSYQEYDQSEFVLANWVKANTDKNSIWLTPENHNTWLFNLTGRQAVLAYPGWLWTQGYDYLPTQAKVIQMYQGQPAALMDFEEYQVNYAIIGQEELRSMGANKEFFDQHFPVAFEYAGTTIYKVK